MQLGSVLTLFYPLHDRRLLESFQEGFSEALACGSVEGGLERGKTEDRKTRLGTEQAV